MRGINIPLNEFLYLMNDQDSPKNNNPRIRKIFSLKSRLPIFLNTK